MTAFFLSLMFSVFPMESNTSIDTSSTNTVEINDTIRREIQDQQ